MRKMANFAQLERIYWFDRQVRNGAFPNSSHLESRFEISTKTAKRLIAFFRDRMSAPLEYDASRRGYRYSDDSWEPSLFQISDEEVLSLLLARKLLSSSAGGFISQAIGNFSRKLFHEADRFGLTERVIQDGFSATWHGHSPVFPKTFKLAAEALVRRNPICFTYRSPGSDQVTARVVEPHHLQYYMASWVLLAWCRKRGGWRKFYLSRMSESKKLEETFEPRPPGEWKELIDKSFGIFQGGTCRLARLRFNPFRARWIKEQIWHPDQKIESEESGVLILALPVSDFREISMKILQFGADVEVLEPEELRKFVSQEIKKMARIY